jgi:hypothetical protein
LDLFGIIWCSSARAQPLHILGCQYDPDRIWENVDMASLGGVLSLGVLGSVDICLVEHAIIFKPCFAYIEGN